MRDESRERRGRRGEKDEKGTGTARGEETGRTIVQEIREEKDDE